MSFLENQKSDKDKITETMGKHSGTKQDEAYNAEGDGSSVNITRAGENDVFVANAVNDSKSIVDAGDGDFSKAGEYHAGLDWKLLPPLPYKPKEELFGRKEDISEVLNKLNDRTAVKQKRKLFGHKDDANKISDKREYNKIILINGCGGVGKTEFAKSLAAEFDKTKKNSGWFEYRGNLEATFGQKRNIITGKDAPDHELLQKDYAGYVMALLREKTRDFLLVIDDARLNEELLSFLRELNCCAIVTTRENIDEFKGMEEYDTYTLSAIENEDIQNQIFEHYFGKKTVKREKSAVGEICKRACGLPMMIELLGRTCNRRGLTPQDLLKKLQDKGFDLRKAGFEQELITDRDDMHKNLEEHINSLLEIAELKPELKLLMKQLGAIAPRGTRLDTIKNWLDANDSSLNELRDSHWIEIEEVNEMDGDRNAKIVKMNDIVIATMRAVHKPSFEDCKGLIDRLTDEMEGVGNDRIKALKYPNLAEAENIADCYYGRERNQDWLGVLNYCVYAINSARGNYIDALKYAKETLEIDKKIYGEKSEQTAGSYNNIALIYSDLDEKANALEYNKKAIVIREAVLPKDHPDLAASYNNIAGVYFAVGENDKALKYHKKAIEIKEAVLMENHPALAASYNNIANVYNSLGENEMALEYFKKVLVINEEVLPQNHPDLVASYNNLANVYSELGEKVKALEYYEKTMAIIETVLPSNHLDLAASYNNIANAYYDLDEKATALEYHEKAIAIKEAVLPENHPDLASAFNNIAVAYGSIGEKEKALEYHKKAMRIREAVLPPNHPALALLYNNIAVSCSFMGELDVALDYANRALKIRIDALGEEHPDTQKTSTLISLIKALMGRVELKKSP